MINKFNTLMLNQLINFSWTILSFSLIGWYWGVYFAEHKSPIILITIVAFSMIVFLLPGKWFDALALSQDRKPYERLGLKFFRNFVQDGTLVNRYLKKRNKDFVMIRNRQEAVIYLQTIAIRERFHYCCLVLFSITSICAIIDGRIGLGLLIFLSNILYNVYPILLQQYNRLRINRT
jgi:hypothetical protein